MWNEQGRPGARCPPFDEPVSPDRPPNPACQSSRHRALHEARHQTNGCVAARRRSTRPALPDRDAGIHRRLLPYRHATAASLCPFAMCTPLACSDYYGHSATTRHHQPTTRCPPHQGGEGGDGRFPRSPPAGRRGRCPAIPRQPRQGYAAALPPGLPDRPLQTGCGVARHHRGGRALLTGPHPPGSGPGRRLRSLTRWFLASTCSSCLPDPGRLAVPARPGVVRAAPTLACVSTLRLPSASPACCDRPAAGPFHPRPVVGEVGPGRSAGVATGEFPRAASRTRRASQNAPGSPQASRAWSPHAALGHGVGIFVPR